MGRGVLERQHVIRLSGRWGPVRLTVLTAAVLLRGGLPAGLAGDASTTEDHLVLRVSFDQGLKPDRGDFAARSARPLSFEEGPWGRAAVTGVENGQGYSAVYSTGAALAMPEGTIGFWVRPSDWDGKDKRFKIFLEAVGSGSRVLVYKYFDIGMDSPHSGKLLLRLGTLNRDSGTWSYSIISTDTIGNWRRGEWHQVSCGWNGATVNLFVDGRLAATGEAGAPLAVSLSEFAVGGFNPEVWGAKSAEQFHPAGTMLIDEVNVHAAAVPPGKIQEDYENSRPATGVTPDTFLVAVPRASSAPAVDGAISEGEYTFSGAGFLDIFSGAYATRQSRCHLAWDDRRLYIGIVSPCKDGIRAEVTERDTTAIVKDDAVEVFLVPDAAEGNYYQFIFNSVGAFYDGSNWDKAWNVAEDKEVSVGNRVANGEWVIELGIPFAQLGLSPPRPGDVWRINLCRSFTTPTVSYTSLSPVRGTYHNPGGFTYLKFLDQAPQVQLLGLGDLADGTLDMELRLLNPDLLQDQVNVKARLQAGGKTVVAYEKEFSPSPRIDIPIKADGFEKKGALTMRASSAQHGSLFATTLAFVPKDPVPFRMQYLYTDIPHRALNVGLSQPYITYLKQDIVCRLRLHDAKEEIAREQSFPADAYFYEVSLDIADLAPGDYLIDITFLSGQGQTLSHLTEPYRIYPDGKPPWEGNTIGLTNGVPAPWTPLKVDGDTVRCWGREYRFDESLFPSSITSQGNKLLHAPIQLVGKENGRDVAGQRSALEWREARDNAVTMVAAGSIGSVGVAIETRIEYDGFMWMRLSLDAEERTTLDRLALEIPLAGEHAVLRNLGDYRLERTGGLPKDAFHKNLLKDKPIFWLGDQDTGLQWFAEDLRGWHVADYDRTLEVIPHDDVVMARLNIVDDPVILEGRREIRFGFQATPVRARPRKWRHWRVRPDIYAYSGGRRSTNAYNLITWFTRYSEFSYYPDLATLNPGIKQQLAEYKSKGIQVAVYLAMSATTRYSPEYRYYGERWRATPCFWDRKLSDNAIYAPLERQWDYYMVCPNSASYRDNYLWKLDTFSRELNVNGTYFDLGAVYRCDNPLHGCGWQDDWGATHLTFALLGTREMAKRIYVAMKSRDRDFVIINHMSGEIATPVHAFADILIDGENTAGPLASRESYCDILPFDKFQAEFLSRQWGPVVLFLPQFVRAASMHRPDRLPFWNTPEADGPKNHLIGLSLVHDGLLWPMNGINLDAVWDVQDDFGWDHQVDFLPYWSNGRYVKIVSPSSPHVVVSVFRRPGKWLFVPFNNTDEDVELHMRIDRAACGLPAGGELEVVDGISGDTLTMVGGELTVPVKARTFRMLRLEP